MGKSFELLASYLWIWSCFQNESSTESIYFCATTLFLGLCYSVIACVLLLVCVDDLSDV